VRILITVFALPSVVLTLVLGVLSDRHERRKIRVLALLLFGVTGSLCAFARGFELLLALRLLQGMGARDRRYRFAFASSRGAS
jgi:MFS transporter, ACDE family, multidrug resistance protein